VADPVASPCNSVCKVDPATRLCMGCFRTLDEIAGWGAADAAGRRAIVYRARARLGGVGITRQCRNCRTPFNCGGDLASCWCKGAGAASKDCLCPICLRADARLLGL
jgi:uncharacterized protein